MSKARQLADLGNVYDDGALSNRNRIINGAMVIDQRNGGSAVTPTSGHYLVDRFYYQATQASKATAQQNAGSVTPPVGFKNYQGITSSSAYSVGASDYFLIRQPIEGHNVADFGWGTANAKTIILSFWVRSSLTGTFGGSLTNAGTRWYPFSYTISAANTWEYKTITIAGDTTGTWATDSSAGIQVSWTLGVGTSFSGTAGAWTGSTIIAPTGATSVVGTSGATFYITGVQLEVGDTATPFEHRSYGDELQKCLRYYEVFHPSSQTGYLAIGNWWTGNQARCVLQYTEKRSDPTITATDVICYISGSGVEYALTETIDDAHSTHALLYGGTSASTTAGHSLQMRVGSSGQVTIDAEL